MTDITYYIHALYNFAELKLDNPEYISAMQELTSKNKQELAVIVQNSNTEVELAENLTSL